MRNARFVKIGRLMPKLANRIAMRFPCHARRVVDEIQALVGVRRLAAGDVHGQCQSAGLVGGAAGLLDAIDRILGGFQIVNRRPDDLPGRRRCRHDRDRFPARRQPVNQRLGDDLCLIQMRLGARPAGLVRHGITRVDDKHMQPRALPGQIRQTAVLTAQRPRKRQARQQQQQAARRQKQQLLEPQPSAIFLHRPEQKFHRRPRNDLESPAVQDVNQDRHRNQPRARPEKQR